MNLPILAAIAALALSPLLKTETDGTRILITESVKLPKLPTSEFFDTTGQDLDKKELAECPVTFFHAPDWDGGETLTGRVGLQNWSVLRYTHPKGGQILLVRSWDQRKEPEAKTYGITFAPLAKPEVVREAVLKFIRHAVQPGMDEKAVSAQLSEMLMQGVDVR